MDSKNKLLSIEMTYNEKIHEVIRNTIKMLIERKNLNNNIKFDDIYKYAIKNYDINNDIIKFTLDNINYIIKIINRAITGKKMEDVYQFISTYKNEYKFLIVESITQKNLVTLNDLFNLEIFTINELLINIIDHELVPKHRLLTDTEKESLFNEYDIKNKDMARILVSDPIARYYRAKIGDIMEIERKTPNSGISLFYRTVVPGQMIK